jgi:nucleotide-binding universal stress UspA family protein
MDNLKRIGVGTNFSPEADLAVRSASTLARATGAHLDLVHVVHRPALYERVLHRQHLTDAALQGRATEHLRQSAAGSIPAGLDASYHVRIGTPHEELLAACRELGDGLIVVGARKRSGSPTCWSAGRPSASCAGRRAGAVGAAGPGGKAGVHSGADGLLRRVAAGAHGSHRAGAPLGRAPGPPARDRAHRPGLCVGHRPCRRRDLRHRAGRVAARVGCADRRPALDGVTWEQRTIKGEVSTTVAAAAQSLAADLIVVGTHGRTGLTHALLGSVAEGVARVADTSVLTVRTGSITFQLP